MPWIHSIDEDRAEGAMADFYADLRMRRGSPTPILAIQGLNPEALRKHLDLYLHLMFVPGGLPRDERELIAVVVSAANGCAYCVSEHMERLRHYDDDVDELATIVDQPEQIADERQRAIAAYARKLTLAPASMRATDVESLRERGLGDPEILHVNLISAYFNFVNRIAQGLGVGQEEA